MQTHLFQAFMSTHAWLLLIALGLLLFSANSFGQSVQQRFTTLLVSCLEKYVNIKI